MYALRFDANKCLRCPTQGCLTRCQYMDVDRDTAREEIGKIARGENSFVLHDCVTCYACEEYCPMNNHPFYLIVERQEELNLPPLPRPLIQRGINMGVPFRGEPVIEGVNGRALLMGAFADHMFLIQGKLFEGLPVISDDPRKMFHYFCQLMYLHYARISVINERLPKVIETISRHNVTEVVCFHDECYGAYNSYCPAMGIEVPFKTVHFFEFLYHRLLELRDQITKVNLRVAYQRPCSSRLSHDKHHFVQDIFNLIGAEAVPRKYMDENALCCGGTIEGQRREGSRKRAMEVQQRNISDMAEAGAEACVFNCPACYQTMSHLVAEKGIKPVFMSDLCRLAIGERPEGWR
jgi:Fe-S oxidoreductase